MFGVDTCLVAHCVESILTHTSYSNYEVLVIIDDRSPTYAWNALRRITDQRVRLVPYDKPFNFAAKCNLGVALTGYES